MKVHKFLPEEYRHLTDTGVMLQFDHKECGDSRKRLYVTKTSTGWVFHCHNCAPTMSGHYADKQKQLTAPLKTKARILDVQHTKIKNTSTIKLPDDFTMTLTGEGAVWLLKYGITDLERRRHMIGYSPSSGRLILPVFKDKKVIFWQGRLLETPTKQRPKYLSVSAKGVDKMLEIQRGLDRVVIVEDVLSAIKVSRHCSAIALLGSFIPDSMFDKIKKYKSVGIWLDADKYQQSLVYANRMREFGHRVITITTPKDPKEQSNQTIEDFTKF